MAIKDAIDAANSLSAVNDRLQVLKDELASVLVRATELQAMVDQQQSLVNSATATLKQCTATL